MSIGNIVVIVLGVLPSLIWLVFYLQKDIHPEPKKWLFLVFLSGIFITPFVIIIEQYLIYFFDSLNLTVPELFNYSAKNIAIVFIAMATVEEVSKFVAVRLLMKYNPFFDEPADAMIYMIVAALGFASVENMIVLHTLSPAFLYDPSQPLLVLSLRFIGATFLHTLSSAIIGYYYALSLVKTDRAQIARYFLIAKGLFVSIILHGSFNYFIIVLDRIWAVFFSIPLFAIFIFILKDFKILQGISPKKFKNNL